MASAPSCSVSHLYQLSANEEAGSAQSSSHEEKVASIVYNYVSSSIVSVHARNSYYFNSLDISNQSPPAGSCSGVIWDAKGHVVCSASTVRGVNEVKVTLSDGATYTAKLVGSDFISDLAVLKLGIPKGKLPTLAPITMGSYEDLSIGQRVFNLSNPFGLHLNISSGICGSFLCNDRILISSTSPISPGSIVANNQGQVVAIGFSPGSNQVVPIESSRGIIEQLILFSKVQRPALGCGIAPPQLLRNLGVVGALILDVPSDSPAAIAGLRPTHRDIFGELILGDIIVTCEGRPVASSIDLIKVLDDRRAGDRVKVEIVRDGKQMVLTCSLSERKMEWPGI